MILIFDENQKLVKSKDVKTSVKTSVSSFSSNGEEILVKSKDVKPSVSLYERWKKFSSKD